MNFVDPISAQRVAEIQRKAAARQSKRDEIKAKLAEREAREIRNSKSPRDIENEARAKAAWDEACRRFDAEQEHLRLIERQAAIDKMAAIRKQHDAEHDGVKRGKLLAEYVRLYRLWEIPPGTTTREQILAYWLQERQETLRAAMRRHV